jgi:hypothetical protein
MIDRAGVRVAETDVVIHVFVMSTATGETSVFLIEREPGIVEFPRLLLPSEQIDDESEILRQIEANTGFSVALSGFLDPPDDSPLSPPGSRFLLARLLHGAPRVADAHVGWEWRSGVSLLSLQFVPKLMSNELRTFMSG